MRLGTDPVKLQRDQYRDASNLDARASLHARFSTRQGPGWFPWAFSQLEGLPRDARVLEVGGGPGWLWVEVAQDVPPDWTVFLSDLSAGMVYEAGAAAAALGPRAARLRIDARALPFPDASFDALLANHMLYHVPDRPRAIAELRRALKPEGRLLAATNGPGHLRELAELVRDASGRREGWEGHPLAFSLKDGAEQLSAAFSRIELKRYEDDLRVTDADAIAAYIASVDGWREAVGPRMPALRARAQAEIDRSGAFVVHKEVGAFVARP